MPRHYAVRRNPPSDRDTTFKHDCLSFAHTLFSELMGTKKALEAEVQPRPTVRDAMHLTLAGAKLVAGSGGLDHPGESPGPGDQLPTRQRQVHRVTHGGSGLN